MAVGTYALTSTDEVFGVIGGNLQVPALWLYFSGTTGTNTVQVNDTTLVLIDEDNGTTTFTFASASYNTLTKLVAEINKISGWNAGLIYVGAADSGDLIVTGALDAEGRAKEQTLMIKPVYTIEKYIDRATDFIERWTNRLLMSRTHTNEVYWGSGRTKLILEQYPITRIVRVYEGRANGFSIKNTSSDMDYATVEITSSVIRLIVSGGANEDDSSLTLSDYDSIDGLITAIEALSKGWSCTTIATNTDTLGASELLVRPSMYVDNTTQAYCEIPDEYLTDYRLLRPESEDRNDGIIQRTAEFDPGFEYFVTYTAGYATTPGALEDLCIALVRRRYYQDQSDPGMKSEKKGDYQYTRFSNEDLRGVFAEDPMLEAEANLFKKVNI